MVFLHFMISRVFEVFELSKYCDRKVLEHDIFIQNALAHDVLYGMKRIRDFFEYRNGHVFPLWTHA